MVSSSAGLIGGYQPGGFNRSHSACRKKHMSLSRHGVSKERPVRALSAGMQQIRRDQETESKFSSISPVVEHGPLKQVVRVKLVYW